MNNFIYETPTKVYFGKDEEYKVGKIVAEYNPKKVLIHYGGKSAKESGLLDRVKKCLDDESIKYVELGGVVANPELKLVRQGIEGNMNYVYIVECNDNTLYTGWTNNLEKRIKAHNDGKGAKYTQGRRPVKLVYFEEFETKQEALKREWFIKHLSRKEKMDIIAGI